MRITEICLVRILLHLRTNARVCQLHVPFVLAELFCQITRAATGLNRRTQNDSTVTRVLDKIKNRSHIIDDSTITQHSSRAIQNANLNERIVVVKANKSRQFSYTHHVRRSSLVLGLKLSSRL